MLGGNWKEIGLSERKGIPPCACPVPGFWFIKCREPGNKAKPLPLLVGHRYMLYHNCDIILKCVATESHPHP